MFVVLWEGDVKPGCEEPFEKVYGPGGDWDSVFRRDPNHCGTCLYRHTARPGVCFSTDYRLNCKSHEEFLQAQKSDYHSLDAATENLISTERHIGSLETLTT
jgi:hypothetical protein